MKALVAVVVPVFLFAGAAHATLFVNDNFSSFGAGPLVGQGNWTQLGASAVNPLTVTGGVVPIAGGQTVDGQDARNTFVFTAVAGSSLVVCSAINISSSSTAANGTSYFLAAQESSASGFANMRVAARQIDAATYQLGIRLTGQTGNPFVWGGALNYSQSYHIMAVWDVISGAGNDAVALYVDPTSSVRASNVVYASAVQGVATADVAGFQSVIISQFGNATGVITAGMTIAGVWTGDDFGQVYSACVPSPAAGALLGLGGLLALRRRR